VEHGDDWILFNHPLIRKYATFLILRMATDAFRQLPERDIV
jgi:hypothetical protein